MHYDFLSGLEEMIDVVSKRKLEILSDKQERFPRLCLTLGLLFEWQTEWAAGLGEVSCWGLVVLSLRSISLLLHLLLVLLLLLLGSTSS